MKKHRIFSVAAAAGVTLSGLVSSSAAMSESTVGSMVQSPIAGSLSIQPSASNIGFVPPADDGAPSYSRGGATRDPACDALQVLPENGSGLTARARPTLQAYFQAGVKQVWLKVEADDGSEVYTYGEEEYFVLPEGKGFAEVPLPDSLSELTLDKQYHWTMVLLCDTSFGPSSPRVLGGIRRVMPITSLEENGEAMSLQEKMNAYAESGLWYDYISVLTRMKAANPSDMQLVQTWEVALRAVNLDIIFDEFERAE